MKTLGEIRDRVIQILGGPEYIGFINARLMLRTGISLNNPSANYGPEDLSKVVAALRDMGYPLDGKGAKS